MSGPFEETPIGNKYMIQVVDDCSQYRINLHKWVREDIFTKFKALD